MNWKSFYFVCNLFITCIIDGIPHLVTVDAAGLVGIIVLKDSLKESTYEFDVHHPAKVCRRLSTVSK